MLSAEWQAALPFVRSPARYTDGEWNARRKPADRAAARALLVYPDVYEAGVCDYGLAVLYEILNDHPDYAADRAYLPWPDMSEAMRSRSLELIGLESGTPARDFDLVGVSLPNPLCFPAVPMVLALAGLAPEAAARKQGDPVVVGGGAAAVNPEPVAGFLDAILLGEGEQAILEVMQALAEQRGRERGARCAALAAIPGVYVPALHRDAPVAHRVVEEFDQAPVPSKPIVPFVESFGECAGVEVSRGCGCGWRLCPVRHVSGEARCRAGDSIGEHVRRAIRSTGYDHAALFGVDGCRGEELAAVMSGCLEALREGNVSISLPLMRPSMILAACEHLAGRAVDVQVGPASDRVRSMLEMEPAAAAAEAVEKAAAAGARAIRLHLTVGLPGETDDDARDAASFINEAARAARGSAPGAQGVGVIAHVRAFVPQPQTPMQWSGAAAPAVLGQRIALLRELVSQRRVRLHVQAPETAQLLAVLTRGGSDVGRGLACGLEAGLKPLSAAADSSPAAWLEVLAVSSPDSFERANRDIPLDQILPWEHLRFASSPEDLRALAAGIVRLG